MKIHNSTIFVFSTVFLSSFACKQEALKKRPNILFILADDLGAFDLSCSGSMYYETPNIDRIADNSMVFTNGYATCQVCSPSRASILTGKFPARTGITNWIGEPSGEDWRKLRRQSKLLPADYLHSLPLDDITLPEALKEAGYNTFFAGKWHLGSKGSWPEDHGFDTNIGGWDKGKPVGGYFSPFDNPNLSDGLAGENLSMRLAQETVKFIKENNNSPFFAYLSFYAVHEPIETTKENWEKYRKKAEKIGVSPYGFAMGSRLPYRLNQDNPVYAGLVESMDDAVGLVLKNLKTLGLDKNTIVIFTSDNGGLSSGGTYSTSNAPLRGGKGQQWEGGIREAFFISVPWMNLNGKKCHVPVTGVDFYPTILELAGLPLRNDQHQDGVSLVPLLKGRQIVERSLIWHYPHYGNQGGDPSSIIRKGVWKLIHYYEDDHEELYNLHNDSAETTDVSLLYMEIVDSLHNELFEYLKKVGALFPLKDPLYDIQAELKYKKKIIDKLWPRLEYQRKKMLLPDFNPNDDWWGSQLASE